MENPVVAVCSMRERIAFWEFIDARYRLCQESARYGIETHVVEKSTLYVGECRSLISKTIGMQERFTHALFLDADSIPPEAGLKALLDWDVPVVSGLYFMRAQPAEPVAYIEDEKYGELCQKYRPVRHEVATFFREAGVPPIWGPVLVGLIGEDRPPLLPVDIAGAGFLLVKKEVLAECNDWSMEDRGEDVSWCERVRAAGYPIYLDMGVIVAHLGTVPLSTAWFQESCKAQQQLHEELIHANAHQESAGNGRIVGPDGEAAILHGHGDREEPVGKHSLR